MENKENREQIEGKQTPSIPELLALFQKQQTEMEALKAELLILRKEIIQPSTLEADTLPPEQDTSDQRDVHVKFVATGIEVGSPPDFNYGFWTIPDGSFDKGVVGYSNITPDTGKGIGVEGVSRTGAEDYGNGIGVSGVSGGGFGVRGCSFKYGVIGCSIDGSDTANTTVGVVGLSTTNGVSPSETLSEINLSNGIGVKGVSGTGYGVAGQSLDIGIHGSGQRAVVGEGIGISDVDIISYGGWFKGYSAPLHLEPADTAEHPLSGKTGDLFVDNTGTLWFCIGGGDSATWKKVLLG